MSKHYDVVVLGASLGALTAAALLAKRTWRVLVLGQGFRPPAYAHDGVSLLRRSPAFVAGSSPAWGRVLAELGQSQSFRRRVRSLDPMFQALGPGLRLDVPPDANAFARALERSCPRATLPAESLYGRLAEFNAATDAAFERDAVWTPGGFFERRETTRALLSIPAAEAASLSQGFAEEPSLAPLVRATARASTHLSGPLPAPAEMRLHGAWTRGVTALTRGEEELLQFFAERIEAHGGEVHVDRRAQALLVRNNRVVAVVLEEEEPPVHLDFVVADMPCERLLDLARPEPPPQRIWPRVLPGSYRYTLSIVVRRVGLPEALAEEAFFLDGDAPSLHVQRRSHEREEWAHLLVSTWVDSPHPRDLRDLRSRLLARIARELPFVERHWVMVDSVHDGLPLWDYRSGSRVEVDRVRFRAAGGSVGFEPMRCAWRVEGQDAGSLVGEPIRTPLAGAFTCGSMTLPALGDEGELLSALSVARVITRTDRRKERMRRELWGKLELG